MEYANKPTVLLVDDEKNICSFIAAVLKKYNYRPIISHTGKEALALLTSHCPDLVLLDLGLPDLDGIALLKKIRKFSAVPVIIISARTQEKEKVEGLDAGADDYVMKPFGTEELMARIRSTLRRTKQAVGVQNQTYQAKDLKIDYGKRLVTIEDQAVHLTQIEFKLLTLLSTNAGRVLTYDYLIREIWGPYADTDNQILRVNMANIRRKIEKIPAKPEYIFTEVGIGYRMVEDEGNADKKEMKG